METTETKKRADKPVQLTIAKLPGRRYEEDKPRDCRYLLLLGRSHQGLQQEGMLVSGSSSGKTEEGI